MLPFVNAHKFPAHDYKQIGAAFLRPL